MTEWQPIETAPKDGRFVFLGDNKPENGAPAYGIGRFAGGAWHQMCTPDWMWVGQHEPTHWAPLTPLEDRSK